MLAKFRRKKKRKKKKKKEKFLRKKKERYRSNRHLCRAKHKRFKRTLILIRQHKTCAHFQDKPFFSSNRQTDR